MVTSNTTWNPAAGSGPPVPPGAIAAKRWTLSLLHHLDWRRVQELVAILLLRAGFKTEVAWIRPDAGVVMALASPQRGRTAAFIQCPPWVSIEVSDYGLRELYDSVIREGASRGVFVTPGLFTDEARQFAKARPLELIDGPGLLETIRQLSPGEQAVILHNLTTGECTHPSCPSCGRTLIKRDETGEDPDAPVQDIVIRDHRMVPGEIHCRTLTIKPGASVQFLKPVHADHLIVNGRVHGDITVQRTLTVGRRGILSGLVAARTIRTEKGGVLEAEARVRNEAEIRPFHADLLPKIWRCPQWPKCRGLLPMRRDFPVS